MRIVATFDYDPASMGLFNNAIGWANFQISGGAMRAGLICTGIAAVVPLLIFGTTRIEPESAQRAMRFWYNVLLAVQVGLLTFGLPGRVHGAIRRDRTTKLIESHRLMPTPAAHAVAGYIVGPNLLMLACAGVIFLLGLFLATLADQDWRGWLAVNAAALAVAATLSCVVAFTSQWLPKVHPAIALLFVGPVLSAASFTVVPALRVMFGPFLSSLPQLQAGEIDASVIIAAASQAVFAAILFIGACRRYRRDDVPALGFGWGLVLLSLWVALTMIGTRVLVDDDPLGIRGGDRQVAIAYVVSVTLSMVLAIGPVASAAQADLRWRERRRTDPHFDEPRPARIWIATALVLAVLGALLVVVPKELTETRVDWTAAGQPKVTREVLRTTSWLEPSLTAGIIATFVVTIGLLAWAAGRLRVPVLGIVAFWLLVTWAFPPIVDGARLLLSQDEQATFPGAVGAASPPFGLGAVWAGDLRAATAGLIAQAALVPLLIAAWWALKRHNVAAREPIPAAVANA